ncbi:NAD(P)H-binding protein [Mycolicibacterium hodleri]|uniref:Nucleoside-diphosphate sugar epimerase n=1 Tax=Mycolicibacterium hodleri TaxID=49897 RepID=A0A502EKA5_9MYCO|nr:NAD(P)H-binding protein [Mycolicibacterium hodleri]TPG36926.1 nucleoside-diphosphate sugar epimerase [Mycolicibacterium hodleri]
MVTLNTVVITGATGNVGKPLVAELVAAGIEVRAVSRRAAAGFPPGVTAFRSALDALPGADAVFLNSRALGGGLEPTIAAAREAGVTRLVALSAINADDDFARQPSRFRGDRNREVERLAVDSGLEWVSLRPSVFASNFAGMWAHQIRTGDVVVGPYAKSSTAPIADGDIAAVGARAFLTDCLLGRRLSLTGPEALTNEDLIGVLGGVLGHELRYVEAPEDAVRQQFQHIGFSAEFGAAYVALLSETVDRPALITHDVERILGRPATTFSQWVAEHRSLFTN